MKFLYSDEDQVLINTSEQKYKEYVQILLNQFKSQGLDAESMYKQFWEDVIRKKMWNIHVELIQTRIPIGFSL